MMQDDLETNPFSEEPITTSASTANLAIDPDGFQEVTEPAIEDNELDKGPDSTAYSSSNPPVYNDQRRASSESVLPPKDYIQIVDAIKTSEATSTYIVYCIRFEGTETRRRYSDFLSLRAALVSLHPCYIVPPLPPKNTLSSYAIAGTNPSKAKEDAALISRRKRTLQVFLNRCYAHRVLGVSPTFRRFLDSTLPWNEVLHSPPISQVPKNPLRAASSDPTSAELGILFAALPLPGNTPLRSPDARFFDSEAFTAKFSQHLGGLMEKVNRRLVKRWSDAASDWGDLAGGMNGFAMRITDSEGSGLDEATEKVGEAVEGVYVNTNHMLHLWESQFTEPLNEYAQFSAIIKELLKYRHNKHVQYEITRELLESKRESLDELERSELEARRLEKALERVRIVSEDGGTERAVPKEPEPSAQQSGGVGTSRMGSLPRRGGGFLGALTHTWQGMVDTDPEASRRNNITKTRESIAILDEALKALTADLRHCSTTIQSDLDRFQRQKVTDIKEMCEDFSKFHREWASENVKKWEEAKTAIEVINIEPESYHFQ